MFTNDYLVHEFTLNELKVLNLKQRFAHRNPYMNGVFKVTSLAEVID